MSPLYIKEMFYSGDAYDLVIKSALQGLLSGTAAGLLWGFGSSIKKAGGSPMNLFAYTTMTGAVASLLSDFVHQLVHKELPVSKKNKDLGAQALGLVTSGVVYVGAMTIYEPVSASQMGYITLFSLGALAEYLATISQSMLSEIYE